MRKWLFALVVLIAFYLDNVFFNVVNILGVRPDMTLIIVVCFGVLLGPGPAALTGLAMGLLADVLFNKIVGLSALVYMLSGMAGGIFYRKFFADNLIIPTATAMACFFIKEHFLLVMTRIFGGRPAYFMTLASYILPSLLLTGGVCILVNLFLRHNLFRPLWRKEAIKLEE
ncbi:MAG: rod shape-determining protein MreD [Clostridia bacterium]|nr:rod shape-determining protein MreD [Clostridia bacterium]